MYDYDSMIVGNKVDTDGLGVFKIKSSCYGKVCTRVVDGHVVGDTEYNKIYNLVNDEGDVISVVGIGHRLIKV